jgi:flagellar hook assembly protein FlgD
LFSNVYTETFHAPSLGDVFSWDGKTSSGEDVKAGYYFVKVTAGSLTSVDKLIMMK